MSDIEDELRKKVQDQIDGKGIYVSKSWDIRVVEKFFRNLFGIKRDISGLDQKALEKEEKNEE